MPAEHIIEIWVSIPDGEELEQLLERLSDAICIHHVDEDCPWSWVMTSKPAYDYVFHKRAVPAYTITTPHGKEQ